MTWPLPFSMAMNDPELAARDYAGPSWNCARVVHAALDAEPMPANVPNAADLWATIAGGRPWPMRPPRKYLICGSRRISKTREYIARRAAWRCATFDPRGVLAPGELGVYALACPDRSQASVALGFAHAFLEQSPQLWETVENVTATEIRFKMRTALRVTTASARGQRGATYIGGGDDEGAYMWDSDAHVNPLSAILAAQEPAMATIAGAQLGITSTPRGRNGEFYRLWQQGWGKDDPRFLVLTIPWHIGNPLLDAQMIQEAYEADSAVAAAEYGAEFRRDIEGFLMREIIAANSIPHRLELPASRELRYVGFADPSGGSGGDSFTAAIAHVEDRRIILDALRERRPPLSPAMVVAEYSEFFRSYNVTTIYGDAYAGTWPAERFSEHGITYRTAEQTRSELYLALLPLLSSNQVELLDLPRLQNQLASLERRTGTGRSRDSVDHPPRQHDDLANAAAGALVMAHELNRQIVAVAPLGGFQESPFSGGRWEPLRDFSNRG
jgi:hypothetical protein